MKRDAIGARALLFGLSLGLPCCSGGGGGGGPSLSLSKATPNGDNQTDTVGHTLPKGLRVLVTEDGSPKEGVAVQWSIVALNPTTDINGISEGIWILPQTIGEATASASVAGASGSPQVFHSTAVNDLPASIDLAHGSGNGQNGQINTMLPKPLRVLVTDRFRNRVANVDVGWAVTAEPGSGTVVTPTGPKTAANGVDTAWVNLGDSPGQVLVTATASIGSVVFHLLAVDLPPPPASISVTVGNNFFQSDANGTLNPAFDTVAVNGTVTWTWVNTGPTPHGVRSTGSPSFPSSAVQQGNNSSYGFTFTAAGTYDYDCAVHGSAMRGRLVVR